MRLIQATTLEEALAIRAETGARPVAGATEIYVARAASDMIGLDLSGVAGLRGASRDGEGWRIGAMTTWSDIADADLPPQFDGLRAAAAGIASAPIRNQGTLGGNICAARADGDGAPCLLALDAEIELQSAAGARRAPASAFILGECSVDCRDDEIVSAIIVAARPGARSGFRKLFIPGLDRPPLVSVSAMLAPAPTGRILRARVAVGGCSPIAMRLATLEAALTGEPLSSTLARHVADVHLQHLTPPEDGLASAAYRREAAKQALREMFAAMTGAEADAA
ncbi:MAG: hypothetical protein BGP06_03930 [Rhizobiales bacterium 65-9]|nr:FAD binding domain-containing protein [Hyphomicrobiales bacterium]OJY36125.1 MAG: hypothetical protein BGP06_03930 [Rhizobiales bacterium 65-9]